MAIREERDSAPVVDFRCAQPGGELVPFVLTDDDFRNNLSPILEASRHAKSVPGLKSLWQGLLNVVER